MSQNNPLILAGMSVEALEKLKEDLTVANRGLVRDQKMMAARFEEVNSALRQLAPREDKLLISDHAIVRWLERVEGMDLNPIREKMLAMAEGKFDQKEDHEVIVDREQGAVLVIRGRRKDMSKVDQPAMVVTVLDVEGPIPEKGQLSVMKSLEES